MAKRRQADPSYHLGNEIRFEEKSWRVGNKGSFRLAPRRDSYDGVGYRPAGSSFLIWFFVAVFVVMVISLFVVGISNLF